MLTVKILINESDTNRFLYNQNNDSFNDTDCKFESNDILYSTNTYPSTYTSLPPPILLKEKIETSENNYTNITNISNFNNNIHKPPTYPSTTLIDTTNINTDYPANNLVNITSKYINSENNINFDERNFKEGYSEHFISPYIDGNYIVDNNIELESEDRFQDSNYWKERDPRLKTKSIFNIGLQKDGEWNSYRINSRNAIADEILPVLKGYKNINDIDDTVKLNEEPQVNDNYTHVNTHVKITDDNGNIIDGNIIHGGLKKTLRTQYTKVNDDNQLLKQSTYYYNNNIDETFQKLFNGTSSDLYEYTDVNNNKYNSFTDMSLDVYNNDKQNYNENLTPHEQNIMMRRNDQITSSLQSLNRYKY